MKRYFVVTVIAVLFGVLFWRIEERMSADAVGLAVGVVFGVLAGLPAAVLVLASGRRRSREDDEDRPADTGPAYPAQPPVIVLTNGQQEPRPRWLAVEDTPRGLLSTDTATDEQRIVIIDGNSTEKGSA